MPVPLISALLILLTDAPQLINGAKSLWGALATFHNAGVVILTPEQIAAMNAQGVTLEADVAALRAAAGPKPA